MTERSRRVVLLIDYDNLQICAARDTPGRDLQLTPVVQLAQRYGTVILARAYAEWNLSTERLAVYKAGIEPAFAPVLRTESDRSGKSLADTVMVAEGMDMLWTLSPEVVVLATSDKDLIPLVRVAKQRGAFVVVLGSDFTAIPLREMADEHLTYRQLITDAGVRYATEAGPGRQPAALPEPSRRRRERDGRERTTTTTTATTAPPTQPRAETPPPAAVTPTAPASAEPVAPVTAGAASDADAQTSGRRRRRRGSRRRSDRLGIGGDGAGLSDADGAAEADSGDDDEVDVNEVLEAIAEDITEELAEDIAEDVADEEAAVAAIEELPVVGGSQVEIPAEVTVQAEPEVVPEPVAAPRERRRRTRRTTAPAAEAEETPAIPEVVDQVVTETTAAPDEPLAIEPVPAPEETSVNGAPAETEEAAPEAEEPAPARTTRPRRVASASRGRSRRP
jgi:hypothetical protein